MTSFRPGAVPFTAGGVAMTAHSRHLMFVPSRMVPMLMTVLASRPVTAHEQAPRLRASRLAHIDELVRTARDKVAPDHPRRRDLFDELLHRLRRAHDTCEQVDDEAWADYVTRLDRALDELAVELGRTSEPPSAGPGLEGMPYVHATRLEIDGWMLRLDHTRDGSRPGQGAVRELAARAVRNLDDYRRGEATQGDLDRTMEEIRDIAGT
jgi:hypothetical protein